jgi:zinc protease
MPHRLAVLVGVGLALMPAFALTGATPVPEMVQDSYELDNGLRIILHQDRRVPVVHVETWYDVGAVDNPPGCAGLSHLLEHVLVSESGVGRTAGQGTPFGGNTFDDHTNYHATAPASQLERLLWFERRRMRGEALTAPDLERILAEEKKSVLNERAQNVDNIPAGRLSEVVSETLYPPGATGFIAAENSRDLMAVTSRELRAFFARHYGPGNAVLVVAGDFDASSIRGLIERHFADLPARPAVEVPADLPAWPVRAPSPVLVEAGVPQARLRLVWPGARAFSPGEVELEVLASALSSYLRRRLVVEQQLASSIEAYSESRRLAGELFVDAAVSSGVSLARLEKAVDGELRGWAPATMLDEVARARTRVRTTRAADLQALPARAQRLLALRAWTKGPLSLERDLERYQTVDLAAVARLAGELGQGGRRLVVRVHPRVRAPLAGRPVAGRATARRRGWRAPTATWTPPSVAFPEPAAATEHPFTPAATEIITLGNGLRVELVPTADTPIVQLALLVRAGPDTDPAGRSGLATLTTSVLLRQRSSDGQRAIEQIERLGGLIEVRPGGQVMAHVLSVLGENLATVVSPWVQLLARPTFDAALVTELRQAAIAAAQAPVAAPDLAESAFVRLLSGDTRPGAGFPRGTPASLAGIAAEDLRRFHQAHYRPQQARLMVTGGFQPAVIRRLLEQAFGSWAPAPTPSPGLAPATPADLPPRFLLVSRPGARPASVWVGGRGVASSSPQFPTFLVATQLLATTLNGELSDKRGWTYQVDRSIDGDPARPLWAITGEFRADRAADTVAVVRKEVAEVAQTPPAHDYLQAIIAEVCDATMADFQRPSELAFYRAYQGLLGSSAVDLPALLAALRRVTAADVQTMIRHLDPERLTVVVAGDPARIGTGLARQGPLEAIAARDLLR